MGPTGVSFRVGLCSRCPHTSRHRYRNGSHQTTPGLPNLVPRRIPARRQIGNVASKVWQPVGRRTGRVFLEIQTRTQRARDRTPYKWRCGFWTAAKRRPRPPPSSGLYFGTPLAARGRGVPNARGPAAVRATSGHEPTTILGRLSVHPGNALRTPTFARYSWQRSWHPRGG